MVTGVYEMLRLEFLTIEPTDAGCNLNSPVILVIPRTASGYRPSELSLSTTAYEPKMMRSCACHLWSATICYCKSYLFSFIPSLISSPIDELTNFLMIHAALDASGYIHIHSCYTSPVVSGSSERSFSKDRVPLAWLQNLVHVPPSEQEYEISKTIMPFAGILFWLFITQLPRSFTMDGSTLKQSRLSAISSM